MRADPCSAKPQKQNDVNRVISARYNDINKKYLLVNESVSFMRSLLDGLSRIHTPVINSIINLRHNDRISLHH